MAEMAEQAAVFVVNDDDVAYDPDLVAKVISSEIRGHLLALRDRLQSLDSFTQSDLEGEIKKYLEETGLKFKLLAQPIRVAITGKKASPGLFETMAVLGKERVLRRMERALSKQGGKSVGAGHGPGSDVH
jgi:glutamyl-tRNA synthetase